MLVGVGSTLFTIVSAYAWGDFVFGSGTTLDPTRIAAQIVTGIGFIGAGAIIRHGLSVRGLTTAAGLWVVAAIGMAAGAGFYSAALITTGVVLVGLGPLRWLEDGYLARLRRRRGDSIEIRLLPGRPVSAILSVLEGKEVRVNRVELEDDDDRRDLRVEIALPTGRRGTELVDELSRLDDVVAVRWIG